MGSKLYLNKAPQYVVLCSMLPLVDTFRTLNWVQIKSELEFSALDSFLPTLVKSY